VLAYSFAGIYKTNPPDIKCSNACKFTPSGGKLFISTRLLIPSPSKYAPSELSQSTHATETSKVTPTPDPAVDHLHTLSANHLSQHNLHHSKLHPPLEWIVVRIEVTDTGCGIKPKDIAQSKLFCKFFAIILALQMLIKPVSTLQSDGAGATARSVVNSALSSVCS
jgi:hypothetical protein